VDRRTRGVPGTSTEDRKALSTVIAIHHTPKLRRVKERKHADIVAAVKSKRNLGLSQHLHGSARQPEVFALEHVEAAAQRQLDAAIRMTLAEEDELAIRTVVAAAYGILRGLKQNQNFPDAQ
jgi:hypothetical protein